MRILVGRKFCTPRVNSLEVMPNSSPTAPGHQRGVDHVIAQRGDGDIKALLRGVHPAGEMGLAVALDLVSTVVKALPRTHEQSAEGQISPQLRQPLVVAVEDGGAAGLHVGENLALGLENALPAAQILNMAVAHVGDEGHVRLHDLAEVFDLPGVIHAHFQHAQLTGAVQPQQRQRKADVVIEVAVGP